MTNESVTIYVVRHTRYKIVEVIFGDHVTVDLGYLNDDECLALRKVFLDAADKLQPE